MNRNQAGSRHTCREAMAFSRAEHPFERELECET